MQDSRIIAAYYRLSLKDGDVVSDDPSKPESCSIVSQRACVREYVRSFFKSDPELTEFIDDGYTGTNFDRPGFKHLLEKIMDGSVDTLLVKDLSRLGRNYLEVGYYLEKVLPEYGIRVILVNDGYDSQISGAVTLGMDSVIKNLINEWYSKDISQKIKSVVDLKKKSGEFVYGTAPFGYRKGSTKNTIEIDPPAAATVKLIFSLAGQGRTISQIARELNEGNVVTPSVYLSSIRKNYKVRTFWTYESVRNIITNRIYTGDTEIFKSHVVQVGSDRVKSIPWDKRLVVENTHTPIITREEYFNARNVVRKTVKTKKNLEPDMLSGFLVCGCCQNHMVLGKASSKNYYCTSARYHHGKGCEQVKISKDLVADVVLRSIQMQLKLADIQVKERRRSQKAGNSLAEELKREQKRLALRLENSQETTMALYEAYVGGQLTKEDFLLQKQALGKEQAQWESRKNQIKQELALQSVSLEEQKAQQNYLRKYQDISKLDRNLMKEFVRQIVIMPDHSVNIQWNFMLSQY